MAKTSDSVVFEIVDTDSKFPIGQLVTEFEASTDGENGALEFEKIRGGSPHIGIVFYKGSIRLWFYDAHGESDYSIGVQLDPNTGGWSIEKGGDE